jgi:glycerol-3-phosphate acyltransferase PlsY
MVLRDAVFWIAVAYLFGSIPTGFLLVKYYKGIDIRTVGSGNTGANNVRRILGKEWAIFVAVVDMLKGVIGLLGAMASGITYPWIISAVALAGVMGHNYPVWLKFKGGKGISSSIGTYGAADWRAASVTFLIGILAVASTRFISLASLLITLSAPVAFWLFGYGVEEIVILSVMTVIAWVLHRGNIKRLLTGTERKFSLKKK